MAIKPFFLRSRDSLQLQVLPPIALFEKRAFVFPIACSMLSTGIAALIALNTSAFCMLGDNNQKSFRCTVLDSHCYLQFIIYLTLRFN